MNKRNLKSQKALVAYASVLVFCAVVFVLVNHSPQNPDTTLVLDKTAVISHITIGGKTVRVDIADTPLTQAAGLSGREQLKENEGMLFVFDKAGKYPFWMKDMKFAIDIIWITEDKHVVHIEKNALPESYPNILGGGEDAKYVLEVNAGFSQKNNLKIRDAVEI